MHLIIWSVGRHIISSLHRLLSWCCLTATERIREDCSRPLTIVVERRLGLEADAGEKRPVLAQVFENLLAITEIQFSKNNQNQRLICSWSLKRNQNQRTTGSGYVKPLNNDQVSWKNQRYGRLFELFNYTSTEHQKKKKNLPGIWFFWELQLRMVRTPRCYICTAGVRCSF
jgi:hypothetical protein